MPRTFRIASLGFLLVFLSAGVEIDSLDEISVYAEG